MFHTLYKHCKTRVRRADEKREIEEEREKAQKERGEERESGADGNSRERKRGNLSRNACDI